jgi:hypothetical protein
MNKDEHRHLTLITKALAALLLPLAAPMRTGGTGNTEAHVRAALYAQVSTANNGQSPEMQVHELR